MLYYSLPHQSDARSKSGFSAVDIPLPVEGFNVAEITLTGPYPEKGHAMNTVSDMAIRILAGETLFECEGERVTLPTGSTVLVQANKRYRWIPADSVTLYVVSSSPWSPEQQVIE